MKRIIALVLAVLAVMSMSAGTLAAETEGGNSQEVLASYEEGTQDKTVISVNISWAQMSFTYRGASMPTWDAEEHRYEGEATEAGWVAGNGTITLCNNSNTILQARITYDQEPAYDKLEMKFTAAAPYLGSAYTDDRTDEEGKPMGTPCEVTVKAIPTGALNKETEDNSKIGTITIELNPEVEVFTMLDELEGEIFSCESRGTENLERGTVFFAPGTDTETLYELISAASLAYGDENVSTQEKNVAINKALTAYYGALDIAQ